MLIVRISEDDIANIQIGKDVVYPNASIFYRLLFLIKGKLAIRKK